MNKHTNKLLKYYTAKNYEHPSKYLKDFCPEIGNTGVFSASLFRFGQLVLRLYWTLPCLLSQAGVLRDKKNYFTVFSVEKGLQTQGNEIELKKREFYLHAAPFWLREFQHCNLYVGHVILFSLFSRYNKTSIYKQNCELFFKLVVPCIIIQCE